MYDFVDTNEMAVNKPMSIQTILNGINLDTTVKGFTTLVVSGREMIGRKVSTQDFDSTSGGGKSSTSKNSSSTTLLGNKFLGSSLPSRNIKIDYKLEVKNNREFIEACEWLNYYLHNEQMTIQFTDDINFQYTGTLIAIDDFDSISNSIISSFSIECADPFKYSVDSRNINFTTSTYFDFHLMYPPIIEGIKMKLKAGNNVLKLTNITNGQHLTFTGYSFKLGDEITIDRLNNTIYCNNTNIYDTLDLRSNLKDFTMEYQDFISSNISADIIIKFKEKRL